MQSSPRRARRTIARLDRQRDDAAGRRRRARRRRVPRPRRRGRRRASTCMRASCTRSIARCDREAVLLSDGAEYEGFAAHAEAGQWTLDIEAKQAGTAQILQREPADAERRTRSERVDAATDLSRLRPPPERRRRGDGPRRRRRPLRRLHRHDREGSRPGTRRPRRARKSRQQARHRRVGRRRADARGNSRASSTALGYPAYPFSAPAVDSVEAAEERRLLRCLGVAAFGAMNVMLLSRRAVGAAPPATTTARRAICSTGSPRWSSCPCVAYAGAPFFESALRALRQRAVNMDVPITHRHRACRS